MDTATTVPRVSMTGITKSYGSIQSLRGVDLALQPGEVLGLVGDNGAGKSTLTKILSGAVLPTSGCIRIDGREEVFQGPADAQRCRIQMVYQDLSLCDTVDVAGNLFMGREPRRRLLGLPLLDERKMHADARRILEGLRISLPDTRAQVRHLSGGQRQAVAIARAAAFEPRVLIMDEPTAALAVAEVEAVLELIRTISRQGVSVILITHRLQDLFLVCDRIMVMYEGQNLAERRVADTSLGEIVELIVGHKFTARSACA
ncbi:ATP-binding cassette domain-containing protein [uncultured Pseudomonas sp.]|uniref:ATP-binding cassette domain-containing protein n=1 Tax=uncultured Pseudomonas sp. TaxID=114707 RepID=UPI0025D4C20E|nr:ATP-binding cassette domain-containing protein [uncultured Pseudomonas sp.]